MTKYRFEEKYIINEKQYMILKNRVKTFMHRDINLNNNEHYLIRSIYFDDYLKTALRQKELGLKDRYKYRIRYYDHKTDFIKLEKKIKNNFVGYKESMNLTSEEVDSLLHNNFDFLINRDHVLAKELFYLSQNRLLQPILIIDYYREPYVLPFNDIRITFDKNIAYSTHIHDALNKDLFLTKTMDEIVLEVKYNHFLPKYIKEILTVDNIHKSSISKFLLCYYHSVGEENYL